MSENVIIALGSNVGDPVKHLAKAVTSIKASLCSEVRCSDIYQTEPVGMADDAGQFFNAVLTARTEMSALMLLNSMQEIEVAMGREAEHGFHESRTIDLDMIDYGGQIVDSARLTLPHPRASERLFVLLPLMELLPDLILPGELVSVRELVTRAPAMVISHWGRLAGDAELGTPSW